jgi:hypothetical protein
MYIFDTFCTNHKRTQPGTVLNNSFASEYFYIMWLLNEYPQSFRDHYINPLISKEFQQDLGSN